MTPSSGHAVRVSARPAAAILMLLPGVVDACVASGALVKNLLHLPNQARQSRPVPRAERDRRAFPHGKACTGRATSFPPPLRTAVRPQARSGAVPTLLRARRGRPTARPGTGLVGPTQLAGSGPVAVLIRCLYRNGSALRAKVNVSSPPRRGTSHHFYRIFFSF